MKVMRIVRGVKIRQPSCWQHWRLPACAKQAERSDSRWPAAPRRAASRTSSSTSATAYSSKPIRPSSRRRRARRWTSRRSGSATTANMPSRSKATPTNAARVNTTSRSARAAPQTVREYLVVARRLGPAHAHHLLRQGTAGRGVQRHFLLVAEPPRCDGAQSELIACAIGAAEQVEAKAPPDCWDPDDRVLRALHPAFAVTGCWRPGWPNCGPRVTIWTQDGYVKDRPPSENVAR